MCSNCVLYLIYYADYWLPGNINLIEIAICSDNYQPKSVKTTPKNVDVPHTMECLSLLKMMKHVISETIHILKKNTFQLIRSNSSEYLEIL